MVRKPKAAVLGVGAERGVGAGLSRRFAKEGYHVLVAGRTADKIEKVAETIRAAGSATAIMTDGTKEADVVALFDRAMADDAEGSPADLLVFNMGNNQAVDFREMTASISRTPGASAASPASCSRARPPAGWRRSAAAR